MQKIYVRCCFEAAYRQESVERFTRRTGISRGNRDPAHEQNRLTEEEEGKLTEIGTHSRNKGIKYVWQGNSKIEVARQSKKRDKAPTD